MDLTLAAERATRVRGLYHQLEERHEGSPWEIKDDMLGFVNDVGALSRLIMATQGRWTPSSSQSGSRAGQGTCLPVQVFEGSGAVRRKRRWVHVTGASRIARPGRMQPLVFQTDPRSAVIGVLSGADCS